MPTIKGFSVAKFLRLRLTTQLRRLAGSLGLGPAPRRIVFVHVPKTAGTSAKDYMIACVGTRKAGHAAGFTDMFLGEEPDPAQLAAAQTASLVFGHFAWSNMERINASDAITFTSVGEPSARLWSLYFTLRATRPKLIRSEMEDIYDWSREMPPEQFLALQDERIRYFCDNAMVRQFAGSFDWLPDTDAEWSKLLETAKTNLQKLDFVCFKSTFDADFSRVLEAAHLPVVLPIGQKNVTSDKAFDGAKKEQSREAFLRDHSDVLEPLIRWDRKFYEFAESLREQGKI